MIGLAITITFGTLLAVIMSQARWLERSLYPWAVLQTIPSSRSSADRLLFSYGFSNRAGVRADRAVPIVTTTLFGLRSADRALRPFRSTLQPLPALSSSSCLERCRRCSPDGARQPGCGDQRSSATPSVRARRAWVACRQYNSSLQSQLFAAVLSSLLGLSVFWTNGLFTKWLVGSWHESAAKERT